MKQHKFMNYFLIALLIVGTLCEISALYIKWKPEVVLKKNLPKEQENSTLKILALNYQKPEINATSKLKQNVITRSKRSIAKTTNTASQTSVTEYYTDASTLYPEKSQGAKEYSRNQTSHKKSNNKYLDWQLNLNVTGYENRTREISDNSSNSELKNYLNMAVYVSGKDKKGAHDELYNALSSVADFIKKLFKSDVNEKVGNQVDLNVSGDILNTSIIKTKSDADLSISQAENPTELYKHSTEIQTSKGKEAKFLLGLFGFGERTTPADSDSSTSITENLGESASTKEHEPMQKLLETTESLAFNVTSAVSHSSMALGEDAENLEPQVLVSQSLVAGRELVSTTESDTSIEAATSFFEHSLKPQIEQTKTEKCSDCEPKMLTEESTQAPTLPLPIAAHPSEGSLFTNAELEKYCMDLINRLGKSVQISFSVSGGFDLDDSKTDSKTNIEETTISNLDVNKIAQPKAPKNLSFVSKLLSAIAGRFTQNPGTTEKLPVTNKDIVTEPGISIENPSGNFDGDNLHTSVSNEDVTKSDSDFKETDVHSRNENPENLPSVLDCEHFFRTTENTKMFSIPNLMDIMSDPKIRLEDFQNATLSPNVKEQQVQFLTDLLKTGMNETSAPDQSIKTSISPVLNEDPTITSFPEKIMNSENVHERAIGIFDAAIENRETSVGTELFFETNKNEIKHDLVSMSTESVTDNDETAESPGQRGKFNIFGISSGDRSIDDLVITTLGQERFLGLFDTGSGDGRMDTNDVKLEEIGTEIHLKKFEEHQTEISEPTDEQKAQLIERGTSKGDAELFVTNENMNSAKVERQFEGSGDARDFLSTNETFSIDSECDECPFKISNVNETFNVHCEGCDSDYEITDVSNPLDCDYDCVTELGTLNNVDAAGRDCEDCAGKHENRNFTSIDINCDDDCSDEFKSSNITVDCEDCTDEFNNGNDTDFRVCDNCIVEEVANDTSKACGNCSLGFSIDKIDLDISAKNQTAFDCDGDCDIKILKNVNIHVTTESSTRDDSVFEETWKTVNTVNCTHDCLQEMQLEQRNISKPFDLDEDVTISRPQGLTESVFETNERSLENTNIIGSVSEQISEDQKRITELRLDTSNSPIENEPSTTEKKSRFFGTIFLTGSGAGGLFDDDGGQINLIEEDDPVSRPSTPGRGARFDKKLEQNFLENDETRVTPVSIPAVRVRGARLDVQLEQDNLLDHGEIKEATTGNKFTSETSVSTKINTDQPIKISRRRGRLHDEFENPIERFIQISKRTTTDQSISSYSSNSDIYDKSTLTVTDSLVESSSLTSVVTELPSVVTELPSVVTELPSVVTEVPSVVTKVPLRPTEPQRRLCSSAKECSHALNERCVVLNSVSVCDCGRSFIRHRETGICEAKVVLETAVKFPQEEFHEDLRNPYTKRYGEMKQRAEETLWLLFSEDPKFQTNVADIQVSGFSEGSLIINYTLVLAAEKNESVENLLNQVNFELNEAFQNESLLKLIPLDAQNAALLQVSTAIDPCSSSELNYCSNHAFCEQDDSTVGGFYCRCKEGYQDVSSNRKYAGEICEEICLPTYCGEHGICQIDETVGRHCSCSGWYFGERCEISGIIIIAGFSSVNVILVIVVIILLVCCKKRRQRSRSYGDMQRRYPQNLELGSNLDTTNKIADVLALEEHAGIKTSKMTAISTPVQEPQVPTIKIINASLNDSSLSCGFDSTFDNTPSPIYGNCEAEGKKESTV